MDSAGQAVWQHKRVPNTTATMRRALAQLRAWALGQPRKSDPYDAQVIAQFARQNAPLLPRARLGTPDLQALRALSRRLEAVSKDLRRCLSRLRGTLVEYAPEWIVCAVFKDWSSEAALSTLERYVRISKLCRTPVSRLARSLARWTRGRFGETQAQALRDAFADVAMPPALEDVYAQVVGSLVRQIRSLLSEKHRLLELVVAQGHSMPAVSAVQDEFGYGLETACIIVSKVGEMADFATEPSFATYCGVTPLKRRSGISSGSAWLSRFTNKRLLRAIFQATVSTRSGSLHQQAFFTAITSSAYSATSRLSRAFSSRSDCTSVRFASRWTSRRRRRLPASMKSLSHW